MLNRNALQEAFFRQLHGDDAGAVSGLLVVRVLACASSGCCSAMAWSNRWPTRSRRACTDCCARTTRVVRIGECDFAVVLPRLRERNHAALAASKVARGLNGLLDVGGRPIPRQRRGRRGDLARGRGFVRNPVPARRSGLRRGGFQPRTLALFSGVGRSRLVEYGELHAALAGNQLRLHLQPIHEIASGALVGFEALSRWDNPRLGQVPPSMFIGLARSDRPDRRAHALDPQRRAAVLRGMAADAPGVTCAVNVSPISFVDQPLLGHSALEIWDGGEVTKERLRQGRAGDLKRAFAHAARDRRGRQPSTTSAPAIRRLYLKRFPV